MDFKDRKFRWGTWIVLMVFAFPTILHISSTLETRYFPVVSELKITQIDTNIYGNPVVSGTLVRARGNCAFKNMIFFQPNGEYQTPIGVETPGRNVGKDRPKGEFTFGPWTLFTDTQTLKNQATARLIHSCHPFYDTVTYIDMKDVFNGEE